MVYPFGQRSSRTKVPITDWLFAIIAGFCAAYLFFFYRDLATRPGQPLLFDMVVAVIGVLLLLEATRRVVGPPMAIIAVLMLVLPLVKETILAGLHYLLLVVLLIWCLLVEELSP